MRSISRLERKKISLLSMRKRKEGEKMNARSLILFADELRKAENMSQAEWSRAAGLDETGTAVSRTFNRGNCKLTTLERLLHPLGYELRIMKLEDKP